MGQTTLWSDVGVWGIWDCAIGAVYGTVMGAVIDCVL